VPPDFVAFALLPADHYCGQSVGVYHVTFGPRLSPKDEASTPSSPSPGSSALAGSLAGTWNLVSIQPGGQAEQATPAGASARVHARGLPHNGVRDRIHQTIERRKTVTLSDGILQLASERGALRFRQ
jgi:hypothetical protein